MKIYAISDLHLGNSVEKPMDVFGNGWENHFEKISADWQNKVSEGDLVLLGGDISWGLTLDEAASDYEAVSKLPGNKVVVRGNHDYYWNSLSKTQKQFPQFSFIQNNCLRFGNVLLAGTRGWSVTDDSSDENDIKIFNRELIRLELSLSAMQSQRKQNDFVITLLHFPPFQVSYDDSAVTRLLEKYEVNTVTYGHLHGKNARITQKLTKNGIDYFLTSCDLTDNKLVFIAEI